MRRAKVAISLDERTIRRLDRLVELAVYPNRSRAIEAAVDAQLQRMDRTRLARACALLDPAEERAMAEEGVAEDLAQWPEY